MGNIVAIVGRPNVGKSTLFNRLTQTRQAIVNEEAGTTRDRQYGKAEWTGKEFSLIDTGGWVINSDDVFEEEINKQVQVALDEADVILFVVDVLNGITDLDVEVAEILRDLAAVQCVEQRGVVHQLTAGKVQHAHSVLAHRQRLGVDGGS